MSLDLPGEFIYITQEVNCKEQSEKDDEKQVAKEALDIEELYLSRYKQLKSFVRKRVFNDQDAEDISQAAFVEAMQKRDAFRGLSRPDVWLFGIALNLVRNHSKKEKNRTRVWEENVEHYVSLSKEVEPDPSEAVQSVEQLTRIDRRIETLPSEMAKVVKAVAVNEWTYAEAAEAFNIPAGTIRSRLSRARSMIKESVPNVF